MIIADSKHHLICAWTQQLKRDVTFPAFKAKLQTCLWSWNSFPVDVDFFRTHTHSHLCVCQIIYCCTFTHDACVLWQHAPTDINRYKQQCGCGDVFLKWDQDVDPSLRQVIVVAMVTAYLPSSHTSVSTFFSPHAYIYLFFFLFDSVRVTEKLKAMTLKRSHSSAVFITSFTKLLNTSHY